jgi:hypothetical protein
MNRGEQEFRWIVVKVRSSRSPRHSPQLLLSHCNIPVNLRWAMKKYLYTEIEMKSNLFVQFLMQV